MMLSRLLELRSAIESLSYTEAYILIDDGINLERLKNVQLSRTEWDGTEEIVNILKPLKEMTMVFSSTSYGIAVSVAPWVLDLEIAMEGSMASTSEDIRPFQVALLQEIKDRAVITDLHLMATVFHPNFSSLWFLEDSRRVQKIKEKIRDEFKSIAPKRMQVGQTKGDETSSVFGRQRRKFDNINEDTDDEESKAEIDVYLGMRRRQEVHDPFTWWRERQDKYPITAQLARKYN
ncbi:hypothetical protein BGW38_003441 [Lunasporangiospora selenospora]|uniref:HAT C-terminal dimerisation domain-containing protein n=1 Tax=Lunasporangiospora selenospora TaxID=979761 RepID=A0A9P6KCV3_9FUNG|nr:hypothetical protein BGW38_003441 [Lunasporangiospora selenospora]